MRQLLLFTLILFYFSNLSAQSVKDFFYVENKNKELPVFIRGNLSKNTILLYVSGSYGDNAIDFARSDYPNWENTLEKEVAIAYYDKRGLNKKVSKIDSSKISWEQNCKDLLQIAALLKSKYKAKIYLMGHSAGGMLVYHTLAEYSNLGLLPIEAAIVLNTPFTTDSSPNRYSYYRPLYLKNLANDFKAKGIDTLKWKKAYHWMTQTDSIHNSETSKIWNNYVNDAFNPVERKLTLRMVSKTIFSKPYNPIKYLNTKDNDLVGDILWKEKQTKNDPQFSTMLTKIKHSVLVVTGRYDPIAIPEEMEPFKKYLKNESVVILPDCGHESYLDQPKALNKTILEFIKIL